MESGLWRFKMTVVISLNELVQVDTSAWTNSVTLKMEAVTETSEQTKQTSIRRRNPKGDHRLNRILRETRKTDIKIKRGLVRAE
jgi:hypothetical protein